MAEKPLPKLRVLYVSALMRQQTYEHFFCGGAGQPSQATQKYGRLLVNALAANGAEVIAVSAPPITPAACGRRFVHLRPEYADGVCYRYLPVAAVPSLKNLITWAAAFFVTLRCANSNTYVLCYGLNVSAAGGARTAAKLLRRSAGVIVSDVPEQLGGGLMMHIAQRDLTRYDGYVLLTEAMNEIVNPHGKPFTVLEGQVDADMAVSENTLAEKHSAKVCLYAGMLHAKYGVLRLVEAFTQVADPEARLVFYGTGDAVDGIRAAAERDERIEYRGVLTNDVVVAEECRATLLINPRPSDELFTRYSFPSKNLEYMVSGTPLLTTDLPGMPTEYHPYVYLIGDESPEGMTRAIADTLALPREALHEKGAKAKAFVLSQKSNVAQAARILAFMEGLQK